MRSRLKPGGVVASNLIGSITGDGSKLFRSMYKTYRAAFPTVTLHPVRDRGTRDDEPMNMILVSGEGAAPAKDVLQKRWRAIRERSKGAVDLTKAIRDRYEAEVPTRDVPVLTDDYAPTDALLFLE